MSSSIPLLSAEAHARVGRFVRFRLCPSFCRSKNAREGSYLFLVSAMPGRLSASLGWAHSLVGVCSWWFPFTCGWAVISALRAAREHAPLVGVWLLGVVALVAYAVSGCPVTVPVGCGCGVSLCSSARCCSMGLRSRRSVSARLFVCLMRPAPSRVACLLRFVLFVGYCVGVRFVSAPASGVTWFMSVCVGVRLTATVIVAYSLLCNGRFQRFALPTGMPVAFVSVSYRHKGRWGESGVRGRWRLVARRTT